jgi:hypothetical protein
VAIKRSLLFAIGIWLTATAFPLLAAAQTPAVPGSGHGYLIDKHVAAGLKCETCHANAPPPHVPAMSVCTGCHGSYKDIATKTASDNPNPHDSHVGQIPCSSCHHIHKASELFCSQCHNFNLTTP